VCRNETVARQLPALGARVFNALAPELSQFSK
jgi:hypothetical protein